MSLALEQAKQAIISVGKRLEESGWAPATSGNYSHRLDDGSIAITVSGKRKGALTEEDIMRIDIQGKALEDKTPSAETLLHALMYDLHPNVNAVLHTHSVASTVLTQNRQDHLVFENYEILKAFPGINTHETSVTIPIFENTQDMKILSAQVSEFLKDQLITPSYLIRGHGLYAWGKNIEEAEQVVEATEFLLACEIKSLKLTGGAAA